MGGRKDNSPAKVSRLAVNRFALRERNVRPHRHLGVYERGGSSRVQVQGKWRYANSLELRIRITGLSFIILVPLARGRNRNSSKVWNKVQVINFLLYLAGNTRRMRRMTPWSIDIIL